ncbi:MAG: TIGR03546 family protein [Pirellulaceae bacterium]|nr:TIGR03546 family protein [Pirellulaceae bacterium]
MRLGSTLLCRLIRSTSSQHRPWQVAMAITVGLLLGILPKTSFLCGLIGLLCVVLPSHLPVLVLTAVLVSFVSPLLQTTLGSMGLWSLTHPNLSAYWLRLDSMPLVPWLGIHNTVVNGSLCAWLVTSVPVYVGARVIVGALFAAAMPDEIANIMLTVENSPKVSVLQEEHEIRPLAGSQEPGVERTPMAPPVVIWDDINHDQSYFDSDTESELHTSRESASTDHIIRRSAEMAAWAEELITEELLMDDRKGSRISSEIERTDSPNVNAGVDDEERWLIETTMEMVRIAERAVTNQAAMKAKQSGDLREVDSSHSPTQETSEIQTIESQNSTISGTDAVLPESSIRREQMPHSDHRSHLGQTRAGVAGGTTNGVVNRPREEALHYLLRHLKGVQEKAQKQ